MASGPPERGNNRTSSGWPCGRHKAEPDVTFWWHECRAWRRMPFSHSEAFGEFQRHGVQVHAERALRSAMRWRAQARSTSRRGPRETSANGDGCRMGSRCRFGGHGARRFGLARRRRPPKSARLSVWVSMERGDSGLGGRNAGAEDVTAGKASRFVAAEDGEVPSFLNLASAEEACWIGTIWCFGRQSKWPG